MEVRIHTSPCWLPTVLPPRCPKTPTGEWLTISFGKGRAQFIKKNSAYLLKKWSGIVKLNVLQLLAQFCSQRALDFISLSHISCVTEKNLHITIKLKSKFCAIHQSSAVCFTIIMSLSCYSLIWKCVMHIKTLVFISKTFKHIYPMESGDDESMNHSFRFKALLPCYRKQMGFHHIGTQYQ